MKTSYPLHLSYVHQPPVVVVATSALPVPFIKYYIILNTF